MSLRRSDRKRKPRQQLRRSFFAQSLSSARPWGERRGLRIEPLEKRELLTATLYVANSFYDQTTLANSAAPTNGDTVNWLASGQFAEVDKLTFGTNAFTSIQAAVTAADGSGDTIDVAAGTYSESVDVTQPLTIEGADTPGLATIIQAPTSGSGTGLTIDTGAGTATNIQGLTIQGFSLGVSVTMGTAGLTSDTIAGNSNFADTAGGVIYSAGGGIYNTGTLTVSGSTLSGNSALEGGAIFNRGTVTVTDTTLSGNSVAGGGGIFNEGGAVTVTDTTLSGNSAGEGGGGIYNAGALTVTDGSFSDNATPRGFGDGGSGIDNYGNAVVTDSTFSDNFSATDGGGIENYNTLTVTNCTISGNSSSLGGGGGIENYNTLTVTNCTISGNSSSLGGGGIDGSSGQLTYLVNSIVAGNSANGDPDVAGDFSSDADRISIVGPSDHDLIGVVGDATGFATTGAYASLVGTAADPINPGLGPLANNGGPTQTMALLPGSPAIDAGDSTPPVDSAGLLPSVPATDQRGMPRIVNGTIDIGAFELSRVTASMSGDYTIKLVPATATVQAETEIIDPKDNIVFTSPVSRMPSLIFADTGRYTLNLTVDYSAGDPLPAGGLTFDAGGNDSLTVTGYDTSTLTDTYTGAGGGTVQVGTGGAIAYSGVSALAENGTTEAIIANLPAGAVAATLQDGGTPGNNTSQLVSTNGTFNGTTFTGPTGALTVNGGAGQDTFNIYATPASGSVTINGGSAGGNVLNDFTPADAEIWSNAATPPVVILGSSGEQPINYASIQQVNVTPGNGVVNVYGDDNQTATSQNDGYQVVGTGPNALTLAISGNNAAATSYSQPINFSGVRTLNVDGEANGTTNAHSDTNTLAITPYADNTPQGWGVQTFWNQGDANSGGTLVYNGVAGVSENIVVGPSGPQAGQLVSTNAATGTPVAVVNYALDTDLVVNGTNGSAGESDTLTLKGGNPGASGSEQLTANIATPGSTGQNLNISDVANGTTLYTLQGLSNISTLNVVGGGAPAQSTLLVDGYNPGTGKSGTLDSSLTVGEDRSSSTAGVVSVYQSQPPGAQYPEIDYSSIGTLNVNSASKSSVQGPSVSFGTPGVAGSGLEGASDTGVAGQPATLDDGITADSTPTFYGTAQAGALVQLYVDMNGNGQVDPHDVFIGEATATAAGGQANGQWTITSTVDLNNPNLSFPHDGLRTILATAQDAAGDVSSPQSLAIFLDTQGPQIGGVSVTGSPNYNLFVNEEPTPTPLVNSLNVTFTDPVTRSGGFVFPAVNQALATTAANYQLVGRTNGVIPITSVTFTDSTKAGGTGTSVATLNFATPLPDDDYTLTVSDAILDKAGNALAGAFNGSSFPTGNGSPGSSFSGSFVVNSHPHLALASGANVSLDINGNGKFDPSNTVPDSDVTETLGLPNDQIFDGVFASPSGVVSGFDELGAFGTVSGKLSWVLNLNPAQGTSNPTIYSQTPTISGVPVAGYFAGNPSEGMQVGLFDNGTWYLDVLNDHTIDKADETAGGKLKGDMAGAPIVGEFDGDGTDLATYQNGTFYFDLLSKESGGKLTGNYNATINAAALIPVLSDSGVTATPVAADLDGDGITDLGLYVTGGSLGKNGEWFWLISNDSKDANGVNPAGAFASLNHAFNPAPLGNDLEYQFNAPTGTPLVGLWDPPTSPADTTTSTTSTSTAATGWVPALYQTVLGRQPSSTEVTNWTSAITSGQVTTAQAAQMFLESSERLTPIIDGYYEQYLGRAADQAGLDYWIGVWQANGGPEEVQAGIIGSPEFYATAGKEYPNLSPDAAWVTALYNNLLSRDPDSQGLAYWENYIQTNSRQSVVLGFVTSDEYRLGLIDGWFEQFLGRPADASAEQYWLGQMEQGVTQDQVQAALLTSDEFVSRSQTG